jgi:Raf kinase inhibitor-like YbhB/YbcL family protein
MRIASPAFAEGKPIPPKFTCSGEDASPPLSIEGIPEGAKSLALVCDDPDAPMGTWVHWALFNLSPETKALPEGLPKNQFVLNTAAQGVNDFGKLGYGGPCPPPGKPHRYFFRLYALKEPVALKPGASRAELDAAMKGRILAEAALMGTFRR